MRLPIVACALALVAALASPASADIVLPGYVETCTLEQQQRPGESCVECAGHFYDHDACSRTHGQKGFAKRCTSAGASHWSEIWCKGGNGIAAHAVSNGGSAHAKGCTLGDGSSSPASAGAALLLAVVASLALGRARRRRR